MKANHITKRIKSTLLRLSAIVAPLFLTGTLFTACSNVEFEPSASDAVQTVSNLRYDIPQGTRKVTLRWDNPAGLTGIQIIKDNVDVVNLNEAVNEYFIRKAPTNIDVMYTVKARYENGIMSHGQTVRFNIPFRMKHGTKVAMLVPDDYETGSDDEKSAVEWFKKTYVDNGLGDVITPANINDLDITDHGVCWVICDRIGLEAGWKNLPGNLATAETIAGLKAFTTDGGNLLLTNHATQLTVGLDRLGEGFTPNIYGSGEGGQNPDIWGTQPVIGNVEGETYDHSEHAIYKGMNFVGGLYARSIYTFIGSGHKGDHNCMWDLNGLNLAAEPNVVKVFEETTNSTVLGTWNHVLDYCCAGIVDFAPTTTFKGRILAVGLAAYEWNIGGENSCQDQLEMFTKNCIDYLK